MDIDSLLSQMLEHKASDMYLTVGAPPVWRSDVIIKAEVPPLTQEDIVGVMYHLASSEEMEIFNKGHELNISYTDPLNNRFRVNFFKQQKRFGLVARHIKKIIPSFEELGLPNVYKEAIMLKRGLVLVAGQSGSGKSTSIAAMLDYLNKHESAHIVTVEDPVEYLHEHINCIFTQREVGIDTNSWDDALKNTLRQRPDVIYIGEVRDSTTMLHAINYAETGHLCIATIHATTAAQTIERVANFFPMEKRQQYLYSLSHILKFVFAQRLVNGTESKRQVALEIMKNVGLMRPLIMKCAVTDIHDLIHRNVDIGMTTFEQSLVNLFEANKITRGVAIDESDNPQNMELEIMRRRGLTVTSREETAVNNPINKKLDF